MVTPSGERCNEDPSIANTGPARRGLRPGLVLAPTFMAGGDDHYRVDDDGWVLRTVVGSLAAHVGRRVAIIAAGPVVLTL
jgi:methionyl aminopeptidase